MLLGAFVAWRSGAPIAAFAINATAAALGAGVAAMAGRLSSAILLRVSGPLSVIAVLLTASTLLFPGLDEVHRWIELGQVRLHASAVAVPWVLLGMSDALHRRFSAAAVLAVGLSAVHAAQPDAGQGTAFALAASTLLARAHSTHWLQRAVSCTVVLLIGFGAWLQPDPLPAVPHVERILQLAASLAPALGIAAQWPRLPFSFCPPRQAPPDGRQAMALEHPSLPVSSSTSPRPSACRCSATSRYPSWEQGLVLFSVGTWQQGFSGRPGGG